MSFFRRLFSRRRTSGEVDAEVHEYVYLLTQEKIRAGMTPDDARRAARLEAGSEDQIRDEVRDVRRGQLWQTTFSDLRYGLRLLRRSPGFATIAVLTIGLGIGANSAIFSVINAVVRKPLTYPAADRLMFITSQFTKLNFTKFWISPPEYFDYVEHTHAFSSIGAYTTGAMNLSAGDHPERVNAAFVTASMFDALGVRPERGSAFTHEQDLPNAEPVTIISHELWAHAFDSDPAIVGRKISVQGRMRTVVGVMPPGFDLHDAKAQLWLPLGLDPANRQAARGSHFLYLVGRLAPGVTPAAANLELRGFLTQWGEWAGAKQHVPNDSTHRLQLALLQDEVVGNVRNALWILQGAVVLVLLIACANVANLLLARAETRHKEFAVRTALGAGKMRILRQFLAEGLGLSLLGAGLGFVLAYWGLHALLAANPGSIPRASEVRLDPTVLIFTIAVALLTGTIFGLAPLLHLRDVAVISSIREGSLRTTLSAGRMRVRHALVISEIALAVMLVIGAGLLIRTFKNLTSVDLGFDPAHRVTFGLVLPGATYPDSQRVVGFIGDLTRKLEQIPGVQRAAAMQGLPPSRPVNANDTQFEGYTPTATDPPANVDYYQPATVGYFETMGIPLIQGRSFTAGDAFGAPVIIVNEALVKRFYPGGQPVLGKRIRPGLSGNDPWYTVIGVAKDVKQGGVDAPVGTELYLAAEQMPRLAGYAMQNLNIVLQSAKPLAVLAPSIRRVVAGMDAALPVIQLRTMDDVVGASLTRQRFLSTLLGIFAFVALTLAAIGTYGILSYMVTERHREIGIRMALGAGSGQVVRMVLNQGLVIAAIGIIIGLLGAAGLSRLTKSLLYGVSPSDPLTFGGVAGVIATVAVVACLVPSWRAARVDPLVAIRSD